MNVPLLWYSFAMTFGQPVAVFFAGLMAGMVNSVAGGGTLISFPTLVWLGRNPIFANATNTVSLWPGSFSAMLGFRQELVGRKNWMLLLGGPSLIGGLIGAFLLLKTPSNVFSAIVPFLILGASLILALQEPLSRRFLKHSSEHPSRAWWTWAIVFQFLVAVYGGYFGAGIGILMLAALGLLRLTDIYLMNGLKNLFAVCINGVAAIYFISSGAVLWWDVLFMASGAIAGGFGGARLARKAGRRTVRGIAVGIGLFMAVSLLIRRF